MRAIGLAILALLAPAGGSFAQEQHRTAEILFRVGELGFRVGDIAAPARDLSVRDTDTGTRIELASDVLFDFDRAEIRPEAEGALAEVAALIRERSAKTARVAGHTDSIGSDDYNQRLSVRRAEAVRDWLQQHGGVDGVRFETEGFGESSPVEPNSFDNGADNPEGRQRNRRVEITLSR